MLNLYPSSELSSSTELAAVIFFLEEKKPVHDFVINIVVQFEFMSQKREVRA